MYNGLFIFLHAHKFSTYTIIPTINKNLLNDSLGLIYVLSSSVQTVWVFLVLSYNLCARVKHRISRCGAVWFYFLVFYLGHNTPGVASLNIYLDLSTNNHALQNGLLNIHPVIIYYGYAVVALVWLCQYISTRWTSYLRNIMKRVYKSMWVVFCGVVLGACWAAQELNWGGFWSWDPVEVISLIVLFSLLGGFHTKKYECVASPSVVTIVTACAIIFSVLRLGVINTVHSFINTTTTPVVVLIWFIWIGGYYLNCLRDGVTQFRSTRHRVRLTYTSILKSLVPVFIAQLYLLVYKNNIPAIPHIPVHLGTICACVVYSIITWCGLVSRNFAPKPTMLCVYIVVFVWSDGLTMLLCGFGLIITRATYKYKYEFLHNYLLYAYITFSTLYVNLGHYNFVGPQTSWSIISLGSCAEYVSSHQLYEVGFWLRTKLQFWSCKNLLTHISGFNIIGSACQTLYIYVKNTVVSSLFCTEVVVTVLAGFGFNYFFVYKYTFAKLTTQYMY